MELQEGQGHGGAAEVRLADLVHYQWKIHWQGWNNGLTSINGSYDLDNRNNRTGSCLLSVLSYWFHTTALLLK